MGKVLAHDVHVTDDGYNVVVLPAGSKVPKKFADLVTNPKAYIDEISSTDASDAAGAVVTAQTPAGYDTLTGPELKALLKTRELPQTGKNAEMVARLKAFDLEQLDNPDGLDEGAADGTGDAGDDGGAGDDTSNDE